MNAFVKLAVYKCFALNLIDIEKIIEATGLKYEILDRNMQMDRLLDLIQKYYEHQYMYGGAFCFICGEMTLKKDPNHFDRHASQILGKECCWEDLIRVYGKPIPKYMVSFC